MDQKQVRIKIGETIDTHCRRCPYNGGDSRNVCELCPIYMELRRLGQELSRKGQKRGGREIERLLAKGRKLTPLEVMRLYELGVDRSAISAALQIPRHRLHRYNDLYIRPLIAQGGDENERGMG